MEKYTIKTSQALSEGDAPDKTNIEKKPTDTNLNLSVQPCYFQTNSKPRHNHATSRFNQR